MGLREAGCSNTRGNTARDEQQVKQETWGRGLWDVCCALFPDSLASALIHVGYDAADVRLCCWGRSDGSDVD